MRSWAAPARCAGAVHNICPEPTFLGASAAAGPDSGTQTSPTPLSQYFFTVRKRRLICASLLSALLHSAIKFKPQYVCPHPQCLLHLHPCQGPQSPRLRRCGELLHSIHAPYILSLSLYLQNCVYIIQGGLTAHAQHACTWISTLPSIRLPTRVNWLPKWPTRC